MESTTEDSDSLLASQSPKSTLPSWVLKMREKIEASRLVHQETEDRLHNISNIVEQLSEKLASLQPQSAVHPVDNFPHKPKECDLSISHQNQYPQPFQVSRLPSDCWVLIFQFLKVAELLKCWTISRPFMSFISSNPIWHLIGRGQFSYLCLEGSISESARKLCSIREHFVMKAKCFHFIAMMKDQRSTDRHKFITPHRYTRFDSSVSHPLPVFNGLGSDKIMSNSETLSTDFRTFTHHSLEQMLFLTSRIYSCVNQQLLQTGVIAVLISLLANEEASIQNYSCHILANLLLWDSIQSTETEISVGLSVVRQVDACDGRRKLAKLLTSPSATVNLAVPKTLTRSAIKATSNVQGVCNKQASRALIISFYPDFPVNSYSVFQKKNELKSAVVYTPVIKDWQFTYFHKSGAFKDQSIVKLSITPDGCMTGTGVDLIGPYQLYGATENDIIGQVIILNKAYCTPENQIDYLDATNVNKRNIAHVKHVCYWSYPINAVSVRNIGNIEGLWGVWETCGNQTQFELRKGGVFRAVPIEADGCSIK